MSLSPKKPHVAVSILGVEGHESSRGGYRILRSGEWVLARVLCYKSYIFGGKGMRALDPPDTAPNTNPGGGGGGDIVLAILQCREAPLYPFNLLDNLVVDEHRKISESPWKCDVPAIDIY